MLRTLTPIVAQSSDEASLTISGTVPDCMVGVKPADELDVGAAAAGGQAGDQCAAGGVPKQFDSHDIPLDG